MDSPSRNPLLLDGNNDPNISEDETNDEETQIGASGSSSAPTTTVKETYRRHPSTPTDKNNFAYIAFYILGM